MSERRTGFNNSQYSTERFRGSAETLEKIGGEVQDVLTHAIGDVFVALHGSEAAERLLEWSHKELARNIRESRTIGALLKKNGSEDIVGFTYAFPAFLSSNDHMYREEFPPFDDRKSMVAKTAEVGWTAILEEHRGQRGWTLMMNNLEAGLAEEGYVYHARFTDHTE